MGTTIKPELSKKNKYWMERHRYYELKHFCMQYHIWKEAYKALLGLHQREEDISKEDPTGDTAVSRTFYKLRIEMVEQAAKEADPDLHPYILLGVTKEIGYDCLATTYGIPCSKDTYYDRYRKFFYILSKLRD